MLKNQLLVGSASSESKLYSDDVFSAYTYTGNGSTQTIATGISLIGDGFGSQYYSTHPYAVPISVTSSGMYFGDFRDNSVIIKTNLSGSSIIWSKTPSLQYFARLLAVVEDETGNSYLLGRDYVGGYRTVIIKVDSNGVIIWQYSYYATSGIDNSTDYANPAPIAYYNGFIYCALGINDAASRPVTLVLRINASSGVLTHSKASSAPYYEYPSSIVATPNAVMVSGYFNPDGYGQRERMTMFSLSDLSTLRSFGQISQPGQQTGIRNIIQSTNYVFWSTFTSGAQGGIGRSDKSGTSTIAYRVGGFPGGYFTTVALIGVDSLEQPIYAGYSSIDNNSYVVKTSTNLATVIWARKCSVSLKLELGRNTICETSTHCFVNGISIPKDGSACSAMNISISGVTMTASTIESTAGFSNFFDMTSSTATTSITLNTTVATEPLIKLVNSSNGGLVWIKERSGNLSYQNHHLSDTLNGVSKRLITNADSALQALEGSRGISAFNSTGFSVSDNSIGDTNVNGNSGSYISWTFRKAPKFFDVVTYTGNGVATRDIPHSLGIYPGMIIWKRTDVASDWLVRTRTTAGSSDGFLRLNTTAAQATEIGVGYGSSTVFNVSSGTTSGVWNINGATYVAYLFAHDPSADGIVQCGSFTTDGSGNATVNLGWEPQYFLFKRSDSTSGWFIADQSRVFGMSGVQYLGAESSAAESSLINPWPQPTATGVKAQNIATSATYIYLAIRRPNKPPTLGTQVYNAIARTGTGAAATVTGVGFAPDLLLTKRRTSTQQTLVFDRLRGAAPRLLTQSAAAEDSSGSSVQVLSYEMDGIKIGTDSGFDQMNASGATNINWFFKRAPGVFDVVCYTGTGVAKTEAHGLGVVPELIIIKRRSSAALWAVYFGHIYDFLVLNMFSSRADGGTSYWGGSLPTVSGFSLGTNADVNQLETYVAYLFATKAGISKVGNYTGNGSSQTIDAGFTTGARFVMIKRTDASGDWYVWDSTRGIIAGNDPHLSLNTTVAEVTSNDSVDPTAVGIVVNQLAATNINVTSATYIYLAFA